MAEDKDSQLSKQDLYILMESYKNNIQLNTTLLEQQKQILSLHDASMEKQKELCKSIDDLVEKLGHCSKVISDSQSKLNENQVKLSNDLSAVSTNVTNTINNVSNKTSLDFAKLYNYMYVAFFGMGGLILSIIGMAISYADKYKSLIDLLNKHIGG
jgi:flagellar biosynthesis regulator FlaF